MKQLRGAIAWTAVGALTSLGLAAIASIGFVLLVAAALLAVVLIRAGWGGARWTLLGAGAVFVVLGVSALPWRACTGTETVVARPGDTASGAECGGIHPAIWFALGAAGIVAPLVGRARRRERER